MEAAMMFTISCLILLVIVFAHKRKEEKRNIREMIEILEEVRRGESRQKFLLNSDDDLSVLKELLNQIFYDYEEKIEHYEVSAQMNQQLMTSLSHDLRTPMTTLLGYLDAIYMKLVDGAKREQYIGMAKDRAYDLKVYIDCLFEWFRLNSDEETLELMQVDIDEVTREILKDWIPVLEDNGIEYEVDIPDAITTVEIDTSCYARIINNIMQNILAHSKASRVAISAQRVRTDFRLTISDNGIGIPKEDINHIFERLYKCDLSRHDKGSGLGLNIVKMLVEKMDGQVDAFSKEKEGASFMITFPCCR